MGFRSQSGSRHGSGEKFQKSAHEKTKARVQKKKSNEKYVEEPVAPSRDEIVEKTKASLARLGSQTFALSPFSQYFDDWLVSLRQVTSEFESSSIGVDEAFVKERVQIFEDVERGLAEKRLREAELEVSAKSLSENNHLIVETDAQYASQTRELAQKRNCDIERLTKNVHDLEEELAKIQLLKTSFFGLTKKTKAKKESEATQKLDTAKNELELAVKNFAIEQEKLHDEYQKKKQATMEKVQVLEKEIETMETDSSVEARQAACNALTALVNSLLQRKSTPPA
jgi:hypothetical protein